MASTLRNILTRDAYAQAVGLLGKIRGLLTSLGQAAELARYLAAVRAAHKPKRNLQKLLDAQRWG